MARFYFLQGESIFEVVKSEEFIITILKFKLENIKIRLNLVYLPMLEGIFLMKLKYIKEHSRLAKMFFSLKKLFKGRAKLCS